MKSTKKDYEQIHEFVISHKSLCVLRTKIKARLIGNEEPIPEENVGDLILNALKSKPNLIGQVNAETKEQLTFQQMRENSVKCALWLKKAGVKKGDVVTICTRNSSAVYAPFLASIYIGAIVNPWEEKYFKDKIRVMYFLINNEPDVIFVDHEHFFELLSIIANVKCIKKVIKVVTIGKVKSSTFKFNSLETILNDDFDKTEIDEFSCEKNNIMDTAIKTFSSSAIDYHNSEVRIPYVAFVSPSNRQTPAMLPGQIGLWYGSLCWTHGPLLTVHAILSHVTAIKSVKYSLKNFIKVIKKYKVTWAFLDSVTCVQLFQHETTFPLFNSTTHSNLEVLLLDFWDMDFHLDFFMIWQYISIIRVYSRPETGVILYRQETNTTEDNYVSYVAKNVQVAIIDGNKNEVVVPFMIGVICCKTPYIAYIEESPYIVYINKIVQPWYFTENLGCYNDDGKIRVTTSSARFFHTSNCFKYKNMDVSATHIENLLSFHPAVSESIVTSVKHSIYGGYPRAHVIKRTGAKVTKEELIEFVANRVPDSHKLRGGVCFITHEIRRLPNGKIDRDAFKMQN